MPGLFTTKRLGMHLAVTGDAPFILELMNDPSYISNIGDRGIRSIQDAEAYINAKYIGSYQKHGYGLYRVTRTADGVDLGICGFVKRDVLDFPDIGFAYLQRFSRQGYGFEAATGALEFGAKQLGFHRVLAVTHESNRASIGLIEKLGFSPFGTITLPGQIDQSVLFKSELGPPAKAD